MKPSSASPEQIARDRRNGLIATGVLCLVWIIGEIAHAYMF